MTAAKRGNARGSANGETRLDLDEDVEFHRRERVMRRVGTVALCAFLLAAFAGLFGSGPLSNAEARSSDASVVAHYERFARNRASTTLRFEVRSSATATAPPVQLALNGSFATGIQIEEILPRPLRVAAAADRYVFEFATLAPDSTSGIVIRYRPESLGPLLVVVSLAGSQLRFRQFVFP